MSKVQWTPAQAAAIADRGGSLLVSAAAGSGKTAVLAERAVRLITDPDRPVDADRLLIVTFTNAAAAELRARIGEKLLAELRAAPGELRLHRQRMLLQRASICTIDAFCLKLLQQYFQALDIPPDFTTADAGTLADLREAALGETLEAAYQNPDFCAFADLYGKSRTDNAAGGAVLQVYDFLRSLPEYSAALDAFLAPWQAENGFDGTAWRRLLTESCERLARDAERLYAGAARLLAADWQAALRSAEADKKPDAARAKANDQFAEPADRLAAAQQEMQAVQRLARAGDWAGLDAFLAPWREQLRPLPGLKGMRKRLAGDRRSAVRAQNNEAADCFEQLLKLVPCSEAEAEADRVAALPLLTALFAAVKDFDGRYYQRKLERKVLEFSDFEHLALRLLRAPDGSRTPLCKTISAGFDAVMVDEYQDTNALQDALYACLASPAGDNLFFVGDLKQSIYRFRQAEPGIFKAKLAAFAPLEPANTPRPCPAPGCAGQSAQLALDANFRSAPAVVDGINFIFENLMTPALGDTAYGGGQRLVCGAADGYAGRVEAYVLRTESAPGDARFVARRIDELVRAGTPIRAAGGGVRPLQYEDCCILLSTRTNFAAYSDALAERGIPVYADSAEDLLCAPHIRPLVALLRVIDNPAQDIYLAAAMLGPMFGFTDDDLVRLRAAQGRISLYGAVIRAAEQADRAADPETLAFDQKVRTFYRRLTALREASRTIPMEQLLEEIFAETGYLVALGAMENGARRRDDARRFAAFCCANGSAGVAGLIRAIDATEAAGGWVEAAPGRGRAGCVTLMTIHRSKGLQFPAVFVADTAHRFNTDDFRRPLLLHREYGVGLLLRAGENGGTYPTAAYTAIRQAQNAELLSEQMRLLYVALTRAQDLLVVTAPFKKPEEAAARTAVCLDADAADTLHAGAHCFADWLLSALLRHPQAHALRQAAGLPLRWAETGSVMTIELAEEPGPAAPDTQQPAAAPAADPALVRLLAEGFAWQYPDAALAQVPAKVSVTSVAHRSDEIVLERPGFMSAGGLTAAEMGTALHAFLEHADFAPFAAARAQGSAALHAAVQEESARQTALQLAAPELAARLDTEKLVRFFESEAFARICAAQSVLREVAFITALPAGAVLAAQGGPAQQNAPNAQVLVQGIADLVLVYPDHLELLDYKTDRGKTAPQLVQEYRAQLNLYALAIEKRFAPKKITYKGIYSLTLGQLIEA